MKITILQGAFLPVPPRLGGATEKMWYALSKEFAKLGHEVLYISRIFGDMPEEEWIEGVLHRRVKGYDTPASLFYLKWLDLRYTWNARKALPKDADIIVTNTFWAPIVLPDLLKKRCVVDVSRMPKGQMRFYAKVASFRANSSPVANAIQRELPLGLHHKLMTIPNPLPYHFLPNIDFKTKRKVILYVGRIHPEKGIDILIKSFVQLPKGWQLKIVGPHEIEEGGGGLPYLENLKMMAGEADVVFVGSVFNQQKLNQLYEEASLFVYPSVAEKGETFGLAPLEAMAWGCAPIVSDLDCFKDFIHQGRNGLLFNHRDEEAVFLLQNALLLLMKDEDLRLNLAKKALKVRESHSVAGIASRFLEAFDRISACTPLKAIG